MDSERPIVFFLKDQSRNLLGLASRLRGSIISRVRGVDPNSAATKHIIYVHFDAGGDVANFVLYQLREFNALGFRITFVSNSPSLDRAQLEKLSPVCREIVHRRNVGYDFAAYRDGIRSVPNLSRCSCLILANDSVYGPLFPLSELLERCDPSVHDVWGATDSEEITYHVQSYFLVLYENALRSPAFRRFWAWYPNVGNRTWVIKYGEIGLSRTLIAAGLRIGAVYRCADADERRAKKVAAVHTLPESPQTDDFFHFVLNSGRAAASLNPTQMFWEEMVADERFPFLKRDLIRNNILNVPFVNSWQSIIRKHTDYDQTLIESHLTKMF